jgi:hypothetical protein
LSKPQIPPQNRGPIPLARVTPKQPFLNLACG